MAPFAVLSILLLAAAPAGGGEAPLTAANRLVRQGRLEAAESAYLALYPEQRDDPRLLYNLGVVAERLGELPRALLWYRRGLRLAPRDPWLRDNLAHLRERVAAPTFGAPVTAELGADLWLLDFAAVLVGWLACGLFVVRDRPPRALLTAAGVLALLLLALPRLACRLGPQPAILLSACGVGETSLPPGSEVWVRRRSHGTVLLVPSGATCDRSAVALIDDPEDEGR